MKKAGRKKGKKKSLSSGWSRGKQRKYDNGGSRGKGKALRFVTEIEDDIKRRGRRCLREAILLTI